MKVSPVLFLVFNRPEHTRRVFDRIRRVAPSHLFIAADGPRVNNSDDFEKCRTVRRIVENIDWDCEVKTLYRNENLGCGLAVSGAISWFFENVDEGIILEDDCLPSDFFFQFCTELLALYSNENQIGHISGMNLQQGIIRGNSSYYFSKYPAIWGWATWSNRWKKYDFGIGDFLKKKLEIKDYLDTNHYEWYYHYNNFKNAYYGNVGTWDYQWVYQIFKTRSKCITPNVNLVQNIGVGTSATHTGETTSQHFLSFGELKFPLEHPFEISFNEEADRFLSKKKFTPKGIYHKTKNSLKQKIKNLLFKNE